MSRKLKFFGPLWSEGVVEGTFLGVGRKPSGMDFLSSPCDRGIWSATFDF